LILIEWALLQLKPIRPKTKEDIQRAEYYAPFRRNDINKIKRWPFYLAAPTIFVRFVLGWGGIAL